MTKIKIQVQTENGEIEFARYRNGRFINNCITSGGDEPIVNPNVLFEAADLIEKETENG